jgi:hypothetical protein
LKEAGAEGLSFQLLNRNVDQPLKYVVNERSGQAAAGAPPLRGTKSSQTLRWRDMDSNFRFRAKNGRLGYHFRSCAASGWGRSNGGILPGQQAAYRSDKRPPMSERGATVDALPEAGVENGSLRGLRSAI